MKKFLISSIICCITMIGISAISASAATYGDLVYEISNGTVFITSCKTTATEITIPEVIENCPVTVIDTGAFSYCTRLEKITIPGSINVVNPDAFVGCEKLKTAGPIGSGCDIEFGWTTSIPSSAFAKCDTLTTVYIPESITKIEYNAFYECTSLETINVHDGITDIGSYAFYGTAYFNNADNWENNVLYLDTYLLSASKNISGEYTIKEDTTCIGEDAFRDCVNLTQIIIPDSITKLGGMIFYGCTGLTSIELPETLISIEGYATFGNCTGLTTIEIPDSVITFEKYTFNGCTGLTNLIIGSGVNKIPERAFIECSNLESVVIEKGVEEIEYGAFAGCSKLSDIEIADSVVKFGSNVFYNTAYYNDADNWENNVLYVGNHLIATNESLSGEYFIREGTVSIASGTFWACKNLTRVIIPNSVKGIGTGVFYYNYSYEYVDEIYFIGTSEEWNNVFVGTETLRDNIILNWLTYTTENNEVTITGANYTLDSLTVPKTINGLPVTAIAQNAFSNCTNLTTITIHDNITSIGRNAFSNTAFYSNDENWENGLLYINNHLVAARNVGTDVIVKEGTLTIADYTFSNSGIKSLSIPQSITHIGNYAIYRCDLLVINYGGSYEEWNKVIIGDANNWYTTVNHRLDGENAEYLTYEYDYSLGGIKITGLRTNINKKVEIPEIIQGYPVKNIGEKAFYDRSITGIVLPDSVTTIDDYAFYSCNYLTEINIPKHVTSIGDYAFYNCYQIKNVVIPDSVTHIGSGAFGDCGWLNSITLSQNISTIESSTFNDCIRLTNIVIPDKVTSIGSYAFAGCSQLENVTMSKNITSIGSNVFANCSSLKRISLPWGISTISSCAFRNCSALISIEIPDSVRTVELNAFEYCSNLKDVYYCGATARWNTISIASWNEPLKNATIHYNCCETHEYTADCDDICDFCDYVRFVTTEHTFGEWTKADNEKHEKLCSACLLKISEVHNYSYETNDTSTHKASCSECNTHINEDHIWNEGEITTSPSLGTVGVKTYTCTKCNQTKCDEINYISSGSCGRKLTWQLDVQGVLTISGTGAMDDFIFYGPWNDFKAQIEKVIICEGVTSVGAYAFRECRSLKEISLPNGITSIGACAFLNCVKLKEISLPDGVLTIYNEAFYNCSSLEKIIMPDSINYIGSSAFRGAGLLSVRIPYGVSEIQYETFKECDSLTEIYIHENVSDISEGTFLWCSSLNKTIFNGSVLDWNGISIGSNNSVLSKTLFPLHVLAKDPTCTEPGNEEYWLGYNGTGYYTDSTRTTEMQTSPIIAALGHSEVIDPVVVATCTSTGLTQGSHCSVCNAVIVEQEILPANGHLSVDTPEIKPGYDSYGSVGGKYCGICGAVLVQAETVEPTGPIVSAFLDATNSLTVSGGISDNKVAEDTTHLAVYNKEGKLLILKDITEVDQSNFSIPIEKMKDAYTVIILRWTVNLRPLHNAVVISVSK